MRIVILSILVACSTAAGNPQEISEPFELGFLAGQWLGKSGDGRFQELTSYVWNDEKTHLEITMSFFVDGEKTGDAKGYMVIDELTGRLMFSVITSSGVVLHQKQLSGNSADIEMTVGSVNGSRVGMPPEFRTRIHRYDTNHFWTELLVLDGDSWTAVMKNEFERQLTSNQAETDGHEMPR